MPEIQYARTADGAHLAYLVHGEGQPLDVIEPSNGTNFSVDAVEEQPIWHAFVERIARFARFIQMDMRGIGLSDPMDGPPTVEQWAEDTIAVMDAAGSEQAVVLGTGQGGPAAIFLAATHPSRVRALVLANVAARTTRADDYPVGVPDRFFETFFLSLTDPTAVDGADDLPLQVPRLADDEAFRTWWRRAGHRGASPATARALQLTIRHTDVRDLLPLIQAPTLVLQARDNGLVRHGHGEYLGAHIPGAKYVELPTADHLAWASETDYAGEIEEFLTGSRPVVAARRSLSTVVFTDIVGSTELAAAMGDGPWRERLDQHDRVTARQVARHGGVVVKRLGDGTLATFDGPARAIQCASAIRDAVGQLGIQMRAGIHTGEVEKRGDDIAGIAVHMSQRVCALAAPGEVLVSRTVVDLVAGSGIDFDDRGEHDLKGVPGQWRLFGVTS